MRPRQLVSLIFLAVLLTLLNALKPLHVDDTAYCCYAHQIAQHPLDPYGFQMHWYDFPKPANEVLAPPVLPYWWAAGVALFGESPLLWKLWLFPFSLMLVFALYSLTRRFARGLELPLVWMMVLSPTVLPSFNLMLDVPALALGLGAIALFGHASRRRSWLLSILVGVLAGLAMETKYTALLLPPALLLYALFYRRIRLGLLAAAVAAVFFVSCEWLIARTYGESHFLLHLSRGPDSLERPFNLIAPLLGILGATASAVGLLGLAALGGRRRLLVAVALLVGLGYALLALVPTSHAHLFRSVTALSLNNLAVGPAGLFVAAVVAMVAWRLLRGSKHQRISMRLFVVQPLSPSRRADLFLVAWLIFELAGYFALTPFPAARRVLGLVVVATLAAGRLAARSRWTPSLVGQVRAVAAVGVAFGLALAYVDYRDARAEKDSAEAAARWVRYRQADARIWYAGHWGFQFYAERAGLLPLLPLDERPKAGEWLILPDTRVTQQPWYAGQGRTEEVATLHWTDRLGLITVPHFYGGNTPIEHHEGPRISVTVYRVK